MKEKKETQELMPEISTEVLTVSATAPEPESIARAAAILRSGGLVAFPTETVYGLGANALDAAAVAQIYTAKGRPSRNPLIVHVESEAAARELATEWPDAAATLAAQFWPGPLTLVLPKTARVPDIVTGSGPTVALRVPAHPVALALLRAAGFPLAAPSANRSNALSPTQALHVLQSLGGRIPLILDGGATTGGIESTVLSLAETPPRLLRPGLIVPQEIEAVIGPISRPQNAAQPSEAALPGPGMLAKHYAPNAPLLLAEDDGAAEVADALRSGRRVGWLTFVPVPEQTNLTIIVMPQKAGEYAVRLYAELHALDASRVERIIVSRPPPSDAWLAITDRLQRADAENEETIHETTRKNTKEEFRQN